MYTESPVPVQQPNWERHILGGEHWSKLFIRCLTIYTLQTQTGICILYVLAQTKTKSDSSKDDTDVIFEAVVDSSEETDEQAQVNKESMSDDTSDDESEENGSE